MRLEPRPHVGPWRAVAAPVLAVAAALLVCAVPLALAGANVPTAYARILRTPANPIAPAAIGRLVVAPEHRGQGLAAEALRRATDYIFQEWQCSSIYLQAQSYLLPFYQSFGYQTVSDEYLEDGIPHVDMCLQR